MANEGAGKIGRRSEEVLLFAWHFAQQRNRAATLLDAARALSLPHRDNVFYYASALQSAGLILPESRVLSRMLVRPLRLTRRGEIAARRLRSRPGAGDAMLRVTLGLIDEHVRHYRGRQTKSAVAIGYALRSLQAEARLLADMPRSQAKRREL